MYSYLDDYTSLYFFCGVHPVPVPGKKVRVVGTNGSLTGYAGGIDKKIALLELEHTNMSDFFVPKKGTTL